MTQPIVTRHAKLTDLETINKVVRAAIDAWQLPERLIRLVWPDYRYQRTDFDFLTFRVAIDAGKIAGVASWEQADPADLDSGRTGLLLHGLYVHPDHQQRGIGRQLLDQAVCAVESSRRDGLLVKAHHQSRGFFEACGLDKLEVRDPLRDYPRRYWLAARVNQPVNRSRLVTTTVSHRPTAAS